MDLQYLGYSRGGACPPKRECQKTVLRQQVYSARLAQKGLTSSLTSGSHGVTGKERTRARVRLERRERD